MMKHLAILRMHWGTTRCSMWLVEFTAYFFIGLSVRKPQLWNLQHLFDAVMKKGGREQDRSTAGKIMGLKPSPFRPKNLQRSGFWALGSTFSWFHRNVAAQTCVKGRRFCMTVLKEPIICKLWQNLHVHSPLTVLR